MRSNDEIWKIVEIRGASFQSYIFSDFERVGFFCSLTGNCEASK
jgi:hypothetical protein